MESKITEYVICKQEAFYTIEILFHILYDVQQTEGVSSFLFTFIIRKLWEHLEFLLFPNTYSKFFLTIMVSRL